MRWWSFCIYGAVWSAATSLLAGAPLRPPVVTGPSAALEHRLLDDAADGELHDHSLLSAALIASGVDDRDRLPGYEKKLSALHSELRSQVKHLPSPRDRAATVLTLLHRDVLTGAFDASCSSVAATLDTGRYNCVTTTILFVALAEAIDLPTSIIHAPGHVRVRIEGSSPLELEPTCAAWFTQAEPQLLPTREATRVIAFTALLGKLYYNRGIEALEARQFADAIDAFERSRALDSLDSTAQQNLLAALNNGALALCDERQFVAASQWLAKAERLDPAYPPLAANDLHLHGQWLIALCEAARYADAIELIDRGLARRPQAELFRAGRSAVYRLWAEDLLRRGEPHAALARIEAGLAIAPHDAVLQQLKTRLAP